MNGKLKGKLKGKWNGKLFCRLSALSLAFVMAAGFAPGVQAAKKANPVHQSGQQSEQAAGFENSTASLKLDQIARYDSGMTNADGGVMEIVDYNSKNGYAYAVNGQKGVLTAISMKNRMQYGSLTSLNGRDIDVKALVEDAGFAYGDMTSVAVSPNGKLLAAAIQAEGYADNGRAAIFNCNDDGSLTFIKAVETGVQPDMITFTPNGNSILTANEGEPREGYGDNATDPAGTVTIIDAKKYKAVTVDFTDFDSEEARAQLVDRQIVLKKDTAPSVDLEPEYIACDNKTAYVTLQEANAIAVLDLASKRFTDIFSVGFEDYSKTAVDIDKKDEAYNPQTYDSLRGIRMPDGIALVNIHGTDYLLTANEGDSREWGDYLNEDERNFGKNKTSPTGKITSENSGIKGKVVFFDADDYDGLDEECDYLFGGRSFTMFKVSKNGLKECFDSADDFEAKTAAYLPDYFNCSNDDLTIDDRSGKKGPEAETVTTGKINGKTYAFITLERIGGVMVYDITTPSNVTYVNYINSRDFSADVAADDSPEGLKFVSAGKSPTGKALLMAACETGGTVAVYELNSSRR
ncbi:MAG: choice-of-anchor I family protein [Lachnospiraceae bacterium]|nr:choice-of-anchor I family protein [Lachnospiraceae bacterium]